MLKVEHKEERRQGDSSQDNYIILESENRYRSHGRRRTHVYIKASDTSSIMGNHLEQPFGGRRIGRTRFLRSSRNTLQFGTDRADIKLPGVL